MALASFPGTDKRGEQILLPTPQASEQAGSLVASVEGQKGSAAVLRSGTEAWAQQREPSAWSNCYRCELGCMPEADGAGPASLPALPGPGLQSAASPLLPSHHSLAL